MQMQRARVKNFLHLTRTGHLAILQDYLSTLILQLFLLMHIIALLHSPTQKSQCRFGQVRWLTQPGLVLLDERRMLQAIQENRQKLQQQPEKVKLAILSLRERKCWLEVGGFVRTGDCLYSRRHTAILSKCLTSSHMQDI